MSNISSSTFNADEARFGFGKNWQRFLKTLDEERIQHAKTCLLNLLECDDLNNKTFLDIGSGSGLSSLAAKQLGASVTSFDYDPHSVACTQQLKEQFFTNDQHWNVEQGSALDTDYLKTLGQFDIVYSWGVLHHTGDMWQALDNSLIPLKPNGKLFIAIYNDQGFKSKIWKKVKWLYNTNWFGRNIVRLFYYPYFTLRYMLSGLIKHGNPFKHFQTKINRRGMSVFHDWEDWIGGYPFEVASPEALLNFYKHKDLELVNLTTDNGLGCNQLVFQRRASS